MKYILFFILIISSNSFAQVSMNTSGGNITNSTGSVSFSIGQLMVNNTNTNLIDVQQGVQFPYEIFGLGINNTILLNSFIRIYPNPTSSKLNIDIENNELFELVVEIYDSQNKLLLLENLYSINNTIDLGTLTPGLYYSIIRNNSGFLYTQKIIKY